MTSYNVYYISSHGFGHLTRCLAQIQEVLTNTDRSIYIACGERQIEFARLYLRPFLDRVVLRTLKTDIGFLNKPGSLEVDRVQLEDQLFDFIDKVEDLAETEVNNLTGIVFDEIHTDISPVGIWVGKKINKPIIMTTNFTWYSQYKHLKLDKRILEYYKKLDLHVTKLRRYPMYFGLDHFQCVVEDVGYISRQINAEKVAALKEEYGKSILVSMGRSVMIDEVRLEGFDGTIFCTEGIQVRSSAKIVTLPVETLDTQNYIAASEFIIAKAGWGTIAECMKTQTPMLLIERPSAIEDSFNIKEIVSKKKGLSINEQELKRIEVSVYEKRFKDLCCWS